MAATPIFNLIVLRSPHIGRAVRFYEALGLDFDKHRHGNGPEHYASEHGGVVFEIYPLGSKHSSTTSTRIGFAVDDVDSVVEHLEEAGGQVVSPPTDSEWGRRAVIKDLDGHTVELVSTNLQ